jgi:RND family efflux transporter MFP subunit
MRVRAPHPTILRASALLLAATAAAGLSACEKEKPAPPEIARPVKMLTISGDASIGTREYPGRIKAGQYSEMGFEVEGKVIEFVYKEGDQVEEGALLARLDPRDYRARYDSALARENHAKSERDRYKEMYEKEVKPYSEYELRERQYEVKAAETREARKALADTKLLAPFDGVMARKLVEEFEQVIAKFPVLVMQNDDVLEIKVNVPERDLAGRQPKQRTNEDLTALLKPRVVISPIPDRYFPAEVKEMANVADPTTRTFEATFSFTKPKDVQILGGMTAHVVIDFPSDDGVEGLLVPSVAVVSGEGSGGAVFVIDESNMTASKRDVEMGELRHDQMEILSGLSPGEVIAISGIHQLRDGMPVLRYEN